MPSFINFSILNNYLANILAYNRHSFKNNVVPQNNVGFRVKVTWFWEEELAFWWKSGENIYLLFQTIHQGNGHTFSLKQVPAEDPLGGAEETSQFGGASDWSFFQ